MKRIPGYDNYFITENGEVYSNKSGVLRQLIPQKTSNGYLLVGLTKDGKRRRQLVHRLVAITYIPNPDNLPEVNHKDKNRSNPNASNLEWCTRRDNVHDSYSTMSSMRNFRTCTLLKAGEAIGHFENISSAVKAAHQKYGISPTSLEKYLVCGDILIVLDDKEIRLSKFTNTKRYDKSLKGLFKDGEMVGIFSTAVEAAQFAEQHYGANPVSLANKKRLNSLGLEIKSL